MKNWLTHEGRIGFLLFSLAFTIRLADILLLGDHYLLESGDQSAYLNIARDFAEERGFMSGSSYRPPLYPFLLGLFIKGFGDSLHLFKLLQGLLGSLIPLLLYWIGRKVFTRRTGEIAALIAIFHPVLIHFTSQLMTETLFLFLFIGGVFFLIHTKSTLSLSLSGIAFGLAALCKSSLLLFPFVVIFWFLLQEISRKKVVLQTSIVITLFFITLLPWSIRNGRVHGQFVPLTTNTGVNLWIGNNPEATGRYHLREIPLDPNLSEVERDRVYRDRAFQFILKNPMKTLSLSLEKSWLFWTPYPHPIPRFVFWILLPLSFLGFIQTRRNPFALLFLLVILYFHLLSSIFFTAHRFFFPIIPFLSLFSALPLSGFLERRKLPLKKRVCIVRHYYYPEELNVRREAEALKGAGFSVDILCLKRPSQKMREEIDGIYILRFPLSHRRGSLLHTLNEYALFFFFSSLILTLRTLKERYHSIQINTMPDSLVYSTFLPKLFGTRVILHMHEPVPELWETIFRGRRKWMLSPLRWVEKMSLRYADQVITGTEEMKRIYVKRGTHSKKITVILNVPDESVFTGLTNSSPRRNGFRLITHGSIEERYGLDIAIQAISIVKERIPDIQLDILGKGEDLSRLLQLVLDLGLEKTIHFHGYLPFNEMVKKITEADAGMITLRKSPYADLIHTNKMYEYILLGKPVIASRTKALEAYFDPSTLQYFDPDDEKDLARAILELYEKPGWGQKLSLSARKVFEQIRWDVQRKRYLEIFEGTAN